MKLGKMKGNRKNKGTKEKESIQLLSEESPFAVQEAYKTIRTNIMFSITESKCKKIVITSSMQGEAKSTTAVNLAIAFAQNHSKVLLIDCDLRLPTVAGKLKAKQTPGLSNLLVGMGDGVGIQHLEGGLDLLAAGDIPPNPTELLGSVKMQKLLELLEKKYEYIILDTPPVCTVADASILAKQVSGVVLVVRQDVATQESVNDALQKLEFSGAKVLGFIFTGAVNEKLKSYKKGSYGYGYAYAKNQSAAND